jgi:hypothetical protein
VVALYARSLAHGAPEIIKLPHPHAESCVSNELNIIVVGQSTANEKLQENHLTTTLEIHISKIVDHQMKCINSEIRIAGPFGFP